jgi:hypothetical protein
MKRFFGLMPANEVEIRHSYKDKYGFNITIEASSKGWTILWADYSTTFADIDDTAENNFQKAYDEAVSCIGKLTERHD